MVCSMLFLGGTRLHANEKSNKITVAAAANVQYALAALSEDFTSRSGIAVQPLIGSSGRLSAQIRQGAPFDVFLSADRAYPDSLRKWGYALGETRIYAYGKLMLCSKSLGQSELNSVSLPWEKIRKIALADPRHAPYGKEAEKALKNLGVFETISSKIVWGESIAQVNQYIALGVVELGVTAQGSLNAFGPTKSQGKQPWMAGMACAEVDSSLYEPIAQGAVICRYGKRMHPRESQAFFDYLVSNSARKIWEQFGYASPTSSAPIRHP
jgi:molybdate transport system substrate-binding protein